MFIFSLFEIIMGGDASSVDEDYQGVSKFYRIFLHTIRTSTGDL